MAHLIFFKICISSNKYVILHLFLIFRMKQFDFFVFKFHFKRMKLYIVSRSMHTEKF